MIGRRIHTSAGKTAIIRNPSFEEYEVINDCFPPRRVPLEWARSGELYYDARVNITIWTGPQAYDYCATDGAMSCYFRSSDQWIEQVVDMTSVNSIAFDVIGSASVSLKVSVGNSEYINDLCFYKEGAKSKYIWIDTSGIGGRVALRIENVSGPSYIDNLRINTVEEPIVETLLPLSYGGAPAFVNGGFDGSLDGWTVSGASIEKASSSIYQGLTSLHIGSGYVYQTIDLTNIRYVYFYSYGYKGRYITVYIDDIAVLTTEPIPVWLTWTRHCVDVTSFTGAHTVKFKGSSLLLWMDYVHTSDYLL